MEHVAGIQLHQKWPYMPGDQKVKCIDAIYRKLKEAADIDFPAYGSLYFSTSSLGSFSTLPIDDDFCLGPTAEDGTGTAETAGITSMGFPIMARVSTL